MVPLREGKIADAKVTLTHGLDIDAKSAKQGESLGERHLTSLAQLLIVVDRGAQLGKTPRIAKAIGNRPKLPRAKTNLTYAASFSI